MAMDPNLVQQGVAALQQSVQELRTAFSMAPSFPGVPGYPGSWPSYPGSYGQSPFLDLIRALFGGFLQPSPTPWPPPVPGQPPIDPRTGQPYPTQPGMTPAQTAAFDRLDVAVTTLKTATDA